MRFGLPAVLVAVLSVLALAASPAELGQGVLPTTTLTLAPASPDGLAGWYDTSPVATFHASGPLGGAFTTSYCMGSATCTPTTTYDPNAPPHLPDGAAVYVRYFSTDALGNVGAIETSGPYAVDTVAPTVTFPATSLPTGVSNPVLSFSEPMATNLVSFNLPSGWSGAWNADATQYTLTTPSLPASASDPVAVLAGSPDAHGVPLAADAAGTFTTPADTGGSSSPDTTPPTLTPLSPLGAGNVTDGLEASFDAADPSGINSATLTLDGATLALSDASGHWTAALPSLTLGNHTFVATAADMFSNTGTTTWTYTVEPPTPPPPPPPPTSPPTPDTTAPHVPDPIAVVSVPPIVHAPSPSAPTSPAPAAADTSSETAPTGSVAATSNLAGILAVIGIAAGIGVAVGVVRRAR